MSKITIKLTNKKAVFTSAYPKDLVDEAISAYSKGYQFSPQFQRRDRNGKRLWDGRTHLLSRITDSFPHGVLDLVVSVLLESKHEVEVSPFDLNDFNLPEHVKSKWGVGGWIVPNQVGPYVLYDYQIDAINEFLFHQRFMPYRGILKMATSSGKTATGATIAKVINAKTIFLVKGKSLKNQNLKVFLKVFEGSEDLIGTIDAKIWNPKLITICSVDTLASRLKNDDYSDKLKELFKDVVLTIGDEIHQSTAKGFADVIRAINSPMRLGLSGTPVIKEDDRDLLLQSLTGPVLVDLGMAILRDKGTVAHAELKCVIIENPHLPNLSWPEAFESLILNNLERYEIICQEAKNHLANNRTILILAGNSKVLAENMYQHLRKFMPVGEIRVADGEDHTAPSDPNFDGDYIEESFDLLNLKKIRCLVTTTISDQGIDIPEADSLFLIGGGKSFQKVVQRIGRIVRKKKNGATAQVVDFLDVTNKYLIKHSDQRLKYYEEESLFVKTSAIKGKKLLKR